MNAMKYLILFILLLAPLSMSAQGSHGVLLYQSLNPDSVMPDRFILRFMRIQPRNSSLDAAFCGGFYQISASNDFSQAFFSRDIGGLQNCQIQRIQGDSSFFTIPVRLPMQGQPAETSQLWYTIVLSPGRCSFSGYTNAAWVLIPTRSNTPTNPELLRPIRISSNAMTLVWNKAFGSIQRDTMRYSVQLSTDSTFRTITREIATSDTTTRFTDLQPNTTYFYRVRARNSAGMGSFSSIGTQYTLPHEVVFTIDHVEFFNTSFSRNQYYFTLQKRLSSKQADSLVTSLIQQQIPIDSVFFRAYQCGTESDFVVRGTRRDDSLFMRLGFTRGNISSSTGLCCPQKEFRIYYNFSPMTSVRKENTPALSFFVAPNPTTGQATVRFTVPEAAKVSLLLFDVLGNVVAQALNAQAISQGEYALLLSSDSLPSGVYRIRLTLDTERTREVRHTTLHIIR